MNDIEIRALVDDVRAGRLTRRAFTQRMLSVGLTAPMATMILMHYGVPVQAQPLAYKPTRRGGGGTLKLLWWQGPVHLNPHFASGTKEQEGSRIFYEPLAAWDNDGNLVPVLAAEIPTRENGGLSPDGRSVTWKLKRGVTWHDGQPFTADDVVFNWEYCRNPETATVNIATYRDIQVTKVDSHTVRVTFPRPTPFWAEPFVGTVGMIIPRHVFAPFIGAKSREAPANTRPVGTGPYKIVDFKPGDLIRAEINTNYHIPNRPHFDALEMKGGGDATSAARAVLQTGEYDHAWNLQVADEQLKNFERGGRGTVTISNGGNVEFISLNPRDPWNEVQGERGHASSTHPAFSDKAVRDAMNLLVDRKGVQDFIYGRTGIATPNFLNNPPRFRSPNTKFEFNIDKANQILDAAGWRRGSDGIRAKGNVRLKFVFQTSVNKPRQDTQAIVKNACQRAGIDLELKSIAAAVFFGGDVANPDTYNKFWADMQMYTTTMTQPDPQVFMEQFCSWEFAQKENKWAKRNILRWKNDEYDRAHQAAQAELDPAKRAALFIRMNDILVGDGYVIPVVARPRVSAQANRLVAHISAWDNDLWALAHWYREA
ncbi:MAG: peptide ABC transporter substrate-binding protein [Casimicrobiaceae bacterium]|nr:peptide ABC transporter substrate-binding protein [Casimicrobiaceae bacterium]MCX8098929.1 peptide ABC transporter substrate-binding protein [Casimicrobiaceae bacterium]MDW8312627.1 peptide ABC transporter substrate-binding protein [Burkholderiales bacterium]